MDNLELVGLANATGVSASRVGKSFRFQYCSTNASAVLNDPTIDAVFIGTRHHLHGPMVLAALEAGKHVFVEKPLCVNERELDSISRLYARSDRVLAVGFNRRFSPFAKECKEFFSAGREPLSFLYRINAGRLPDGHWVEDPEQGHGRVIGEVCHFVDLFGFLSGSFPVEVQAWPIGKCPDESNVHIQVSLADGSKGEILYLASGDASVPKERLEVFGRGRTAICDDFRKSFFHHSNHGRSKSLFRQDKGPSRSAVLHRRGLRESADADTFPESLGNHAGDLPDPRVTVRRGCTPRDHTVGAQNRYFVNLRAVASWATILRPCRGCGTARCRGRLCQLTSNSGH